MNFIRLYIGDYMRDTGTLSVAEHGAYVLMLLHHYGTEKPLPVGRELYRLLRAESKADRDAIDAVVSKFWAATPEGLINARASKEMQRAEHQREVNRIVGAKGGRPKRKETESVSESVSESQPNANPNQTPDTIKREIHPPTTSGPPADAGSGSALTVRDLVAEGIPQDVAADWMRVRKAKRAPLTRTAWEGVKREAEAASMTPAEAVRTATERGWQGFKAAWLSAQVGGRAAPSDVFAGAA